MPLQQRRLAVDLVLLAVLAALWGASYTFIKIGVETIPPVTLIAARTLIAGAILCTIIVLRRVTVPRDAAIWRAFAVQACLNCVFPFTLIAAAERTVDAGLAAILNATSPVFAFLFSIGVARREPGAARKIAGVGAGLAGTCLVVGVGALGGLGHGVGPQLAVVLASACYGGAALFGRTFRSLDPILPAAGSMVCGATILVPLSFAVDAPWRLTPSAASVLALLALSTVSTALAFVIYFRLIRTLGAVATTAQAYLRVPVGVAIGVLALGETLSPTVWAGFGIVVAGVAAMSVPVRVPSAGASVGRREARPRHRVP